MATGFGLIGQEVRAAPTLRAQVSQEGDFALIGNTLGHECAAGTPAPVVGTVGLCGMSIDDSAPDVFWRADALLPGQAQANTLITAAQARSSAMLAVPAGGQVTHAFLYWGATLAAPGTDMEITLDREGGFSTPIMASKCYQSNNNSYQCLADVTTIVQAEGVGSYRVSDVNIVPLADLNSSSVFGGWWMAVFYTDPNGTQRNLALFDGLDPVSNGMPQNTMLTGFLVPNNGFTAKLGVIAYEGDNTITGDSFLFNGGMALTNAQNPANNFFNGTRSTLGMATSVVGDLPQLTGTPQSMSGVDFDIVDVTAKVMGGQTSATIQGTSTGDVYYLAGFVTSISDYRPNFSTSTKTVTDLNGGVPIPGDVLEYELVAINTGNDTAINVVLTDDLPAGVTYVPGTLEITAGPNAGAKTDAAADDQGDFAGGVVTFRLGTGADGTQGGTIPVNASSTVKFQVTIDDDAQGIIANQGIINAAGENGAPPSDTPTDGNGGGDGMPPTEFLVEECGDDSMCPADTPVCNLMGEPNKCVQCIEDADCDGLVPICEAMTGLCVCIPEGVEVCDGFDNDCNGGLDEGFGVGDPCMVGVGACSAMGALVCDGLDSTVCDVMPGEPTEEVCDQLDNNCDGSTDEGLGVGDPCTVGLGECAADGVLACDGGGGTVCDGMEGTPGVEICGDQLDSDCDGNNQNGCSCTSDSDCGGPDSGQVCEPDICVAGCRGVGGNGCPAGLVCTSNDENVGECVPDSGTGSDSNTGGTGDEDSNGVPTEDSTPTEGGGNSNTAGATETATDSATDSDTTGGGTLEIDDEGLGCECNSNERGAPAGLALLGLLALGRRRRRAV
jgi:uncharacterized repeat protein (TIGR01451 family)/MYXO-CTERM domain-containing protein